MATTSGISFSGIASGLDTSSIVEAMLRIDRTRIDSLRTQSTAITSQISALGALRSKLTSLTSRLNALRFESQFYLRTAVTDTPAGQAAIVSATADSTAALGSFKINVEQLATATRRTGASGISDQTFDAGAALASSGLILTPTAGRFTVAGTTIDASGATKIEDFVSAINAQQATVIAEFVDAGGNAIAGPPFTGATRIRLRNADASNTPISVGSAGDTSNFLTAAKLSTAVQVGDRLESTTTLGRARLGEVLASARLGAAIDATGSFTINGETFTYDATTDTLGSIIADINASPANVTASYDTVADRLTIVSKATGAQAIALSEPGGGSGNLLSVLRVTNGAGATETLGQNARYSIDTVAGGAVQTSTSNTVVGVVTGVSINLLKTNPAATDAPVTITVGQDADKIAAGVKEVVTAFNEVVDFIRTNTRPDANGKPGALQGSTGVRLLGDQLRQIATAAVSGLSGPYSSLADIGITTGAVGSATGTTNNLVLDESKLKQRLQENPQAVYELLNNAAAGSEGVFTRQRSTLDAATLPGGVVSASTDGATARRTALDERVKSLERLLDLKRRRLEAQFSRMESALAAFQAQSSRLQGQIAKMGQSG